MSECKRDPVFGCDNQGNELVIFDENHSLADIARWIATNTDEAEEMIVLLRSMVDGTNDMVMQ